MESALTFSLPKHSGPLRYKLLESIWDLSMDQIDMFEVMLKMIFNCIAVWTVYRFKMIVKLFLYDL